MAYSLANWRTIISAAFYGNEVNMGRCAWLRAGGVNILLTERKTPPMDLAQLRHIGITCQKRKR